MYKSSIHFERTPEEQRNQMLAWKRSDEAFFGAGACHILAYTFKWLHEESDYDIIFIKPKEPFTHGNHVYVTDGEWAFDFNGWTKEKELLAEAEKAYGGKYPGWQYERMILDCDLETFCKENYHRPPAYYAYLPWERTYAFIDKFDE